MKTSYRLIPASDRKSRILDTLEELRAAKSDLRDKNLGYYAFEVNEQDGKLNMTLLSGWQPKV